jgi:hypothetical protein
VLLGIAQLQPAFRATNEGSERHAQQIKNFTRPGN